MKVFYDPVTRGFYKSGWSTTIPTSAIEITEEQRVFLIQEQAIGNQIFVKDGAVTSSPSFPPSIEALTNLERSWRDSELAHADIELNKVQDSDPKAVGTVTQWRDYRKALRAWPEHEKFPNKEFRPVAPGA